MELLGIFLSVLLGLLSPAGWAIDLLSEDAIRHRFASVEDLRVRIDNVPTHQILQGKLEQVRIAGRGLWLIPIASREDLQFRIALLEVETDPIDLDVQHLDDGVVLEQPFRAGVRLGLEEADLHGAFHRPGEPPLTVTLGDYTLLNPQIDFLGDDRLRVQVSVQEGENSEPIQVLVESGFRVQRGRYLEFLDPRVRVEGEDAPPQLLESLLGGSNGPLDLDRLTPQGTIVRLLQFRITPDRFEIAAFVSIEPFDENKRYGVNQSEIARN